jgi:hypothetical protein
VDPAAYCVNSASMLPNCPFILIKRGRCAAPGPALPRHPTGRASIPITLTGRQSDNWPEPLSSATDCLARGHLV